jgi:hypothetical protein
MHDSTKDDTGQAQKEKTYVFARTKKGKDGEEDTIEEVEVKESDLTPELMVALAQELWKYFLYLPGPAQDIFLQRVDAEIASNKMMIDAAHNDRKRGGGNEGGKIILLGGDA